MRIAVLTFDGFNEIDSFVTSHLLNRGKRLTAKAVDPGFAPIEVAVSL